MHKQIYVKKFWIGIIAVALVQMGFILYLSTARLYDAMNTIGAEVKPVVDKGVDRELASTVDEEYWVPADASVAIPISSYPAKSHRETVQALARINRPTPERTAKNNTVETVPSHKRMIVVITDPYAGKPPSEIRPENSTTAKGDRSAKRSFIGKVTPIIKKPYDWLKIVASRLR